MLDGLPPSLKEAAAVLFLWAGSSGFIRGEDAGTFAEEGGQTTIIVHQTFNFESDATRGAPQGWTQSLDRLTEYLAKAAD